jgi:hypothetical protein
LGAFVGLGVLGGLVGLGVFLGLGVLVGWGVATCVVGVAVAAGPGGPKALPTSDSTLSMPPPRNVRPTIAIAATSARRRLYSTSPWPR